MDDLIAFDALKTRVLKYILYKKRTEKEIRLKFSDSNESLLDDVIYYLKEAGYIDDIAYIQRAVIEFINLKSMSIKEISYKLYSKGIKKDDIDNYIYNQKEFLEDYEKESAKKICIKKMNTMKIEDIVLFLKKKGYTEESIKYGTEELK